MMALAGKLVTAAMAFALAGTASAHDGEFHCTNCKAWNVAQRPFNIYGNTYYVGTQELSALLVTSPQGHILLDGALPQSAPLIAANIKALGFRIEDVKLILNSHAHFDHAGGIAALQRASGATVVASAHGAKVLEDGVIGKDDAQYNPAEDPRVEKVAAVKVVADGDVVKVGSLAVTARMTPGHTLGSTTWTWQSCENKRCLDVVYADSLSAVSADGYKFGANPALVAHFRATFDKVEALKCDIVVSPHPGVTFTIEHFAAKTATVNPFIDPKGCAELAAYSRKRLGERLEAEKLPTK
jgi:metallo-beta-lactamase class B